MTGQVLQFGGSLIAISALVAFAHWLGFSRKGRLRSEEEAAEHLRLAAGGFDPEHLILDREGQAALAQDQGGRSAVLVSHGNRFVARVLSDTARISSQDGALHIADQTLGRTTIVLRIDNMVPDWVLALGGDR